MEKKQENCVTINIYVNCNKEKHEGSCKVNYPNQEDKEKCEESCVDINIFVECEKKEKK